MADFGYDDHGERPQSNDPERLLAGEDFDGGLAPLPPGVKAREVGLIYDGRVGRHLVRFVFLVDKDGEPHFACVWNPVKPRKLKPKLIEKFRGERQEFSRAVAEQFDVGIQVIDRLNGDGRPRVRELVYPDGVCEPVEEIH